MLDLCFKLLIVKDIGERQEAVNPVRSTLPAVAFAAEPAIILADYLRIGFVEICGNSVALTLERLPQPARGFDCSQRKFFVLSFEFGGFVAGREQN